MPVNLVRSLRDAITAELVSSEDAKSSSDALFTLVRKFLNNHSDLISSLDDAFGRNSSLYHLNSCLVEVLGSRRVVLLINNHILCKYKELDGDDDDDQDIKCRIGVGEQLSDSFTIMDKLEWHVHYKEVIMNALAVIVEAKVLALCKDAFDEYHAPVVRRWVRESVMPFARCIFMNPGRSGRRGPEQPKN